MNVNHRYLVLGKTCFHLGLLDRATVLLQTGKSLARAAFRYKSSSWFDDHFSEYNIPFSDVTISRPPTTIPTRSSLTKCETVNQLLAKTKFHLCRRTTAIAAFDAGFYSEAIRHFSKIIDSSGTPQIFLVECYVLRALAYRSACRITDSIADCNRTLSLDPKCFNALEVRSSIFETIHCYQDCLHDLECLRLLYIEILRDHKLFAPVWKPHNVRYNEIPKKINIITAKTEQLKQKMDNAEMFNVDYYTLMGLPHGCDQSELERAYRLLDLRHNPENATCFIERCELDEEQNVQSIKDRARTSAELLYKLIEKGYSSVMNTIMEEEVDDKRRKMVW
jgi:tetratricopeptide (TPR) repeat protein